MSMFVRVDLEGHYCILTKTANIVLCRKTQQRAKGVYIDSHFASTTISDSEATGFKRRCSHPEDQIRQEHE